jgi:hypothetical protein
MIRIVFLLVAVLSFGCGSKGGDAVGKYTEFKDAMCKCKDADCAKKVTDDMSKWGQEMAKKEGDKKPDAKEVAEMAKKMQPIMAELTKCTTAAMGGGGGGAKAGGDDKKAAMSAVTFKANGKKNDKGWSKYDATNTSDKAVKFISVYNYAYDKDGKQLARTKGNLSWNGEIKPGASQEIDYGNDPAPEGATDFEMCYDSIKFEGGEMISGKMDTCPNSDRPKGGAK